MKHFPDLLLSPNN